MLKILIVFIGTLIGFIVADSVAALDSVRQSARQGIATVSKSFFQFVGQFAGKFSDNTLIPLGVVAVLCLLIFIFIGKPLIFIIALIAGALYKDEIGSLPFVSGIANMIKGKLKSKLGGPE